MKAGVPQKYLERYAEPEARSLGHLLGQWKSVVCIPACREEDSLVSTLRQMATVPGAQNALVVVVINGAEDADEAVHEENHRSAQQIRAIAGLGREAVGLGQLQGMGIFLLDRFSENCRLPAGQGVGLARKIAGDVALALIESGQVESDWIRCTDADVELPEDYFSSLSHKSQGESAAVYPFVHLPEGDALQREALRLYEAYLHDYVSGLKRAGSPYAYQSIGSLIAVHAHAYAVVRGFPKRQAGEDFYLLNKLAKVGSVLQIEGDPVRIRGRVSSRVPFGTGAAVQAIRKDLEEGRPYRVYNPSVFQALAFWLDGLRSFSEHADVDRLRKELVNASGPLSGPLLRTLESQGAFSAAKKASEQVHGALLLRRLMEWNDAFRTLKLIHGLRDSGLGEIDAPY